MCENGENAKKKLNGFIPKKKRGRPPRPKGDSDSDDRAKRTRKAKERSKGREERLCYGRTGR